MTKKKSATEFSKPLTMAKKAKATEGKASSAAKKSKRTRREIQVVSCPADFPISARNLGGKPSDNQQQFDSEQKFLERQEEYERKKRLLDWHDTAKEIRAVGAESFVGKQKRNFQEEQYEFLTGRKKKKPSVPLPIAMGIKKAATKRLAKQVQEARESGTVLPKNFTKKSMTKKDRTSRIHGPAPGVGFMKKGVLKVKGPP